MNGSRNGEVVPEQGFKGLETIVFILMNVMSKTGPYVLVQGLDKVNGKATDALAGELWEVKKERIKKSSKFGIMPGWDLFSVSKIICIFCL